MAGVTAEPPQDVALPDSSGGFSRAWLWAAAVVAYGLVLISHLRLEWEANPQYNYGWAVPMLAAYLFWLRWQDRPAVARNPATLPAAGAVVLGAAFLILWGSVRWLQEANGDWRLLSWMMVLPVVGLAMGWVFLAGGKKWMGHFAFPLAFILIAVPWPTRWEEAWIHGLTRLVAALSVEGLNFLGIPAIQRGNLIETASGIVGIDEACSGVRSFQATLMVALFFGEMHRFRFSWRLGLVVWGGFLAFSGNIARSFFLAYVSAGGGAKGVNTWHDPAGYTVLAGCLAVLWGTVLYLEKKTRPAAAQTAARSAAIGKERNAPPQGNLFLAAVLLAGLVAVEAGVEIWYRLHERDLVKRPDWSVAWPKDIEDFKKTALPSQAVEWLRCDLHDAASWRAPDGSRWWWVYLRWIPGKNAAILARIHTPEICLPASGWQFVGSLGERTLEVHGMALPFRVLEFRENGRPLYVYHCIWEDYGAAGGDRQLLTDMSVRNRIRVAVQGIRDQGQRVLEVAIAGKANVEEAEDSLREMLPKILRIDT
jgi:exosortase